MEQSVVVGLSIIKCLCLLAFLALVWGCAAETSQSKYNGYIEAEYVYVAAPSSGWLTEVAVRQGDKVSVGNILFELDKTHQQILVQQAQQAMNQATAQVQDLEQGARPEEIKALQAQLDEAKANAKLAAIEKERVLELIQSGSASAAAGDQALQNWKAAQARVENIEANIHVAKMPARVQALKAARARQKIQQAALDEAHWQLQQRTISSARSGYVEDVFHRRGEFVTTGIPVISLLPEDALKARFYVPQSVLSDLRIGTPVRVTWDRQSAPVNASVSFISQTAEYTPPVIFSTESRDKLVFMVEAKLTEASLRPGQPVDVELP